MKNEAINIIGRGVNDPHIHIFNNRAYLYASHDDSIDNTKFVMKDWWVWSSDDLLNWKHESTLKPEEIYIKKPSDACWATDAVEKNGKYYWALSDMNRDGDGARIGMVVSDNPGGPWRDPLGKPLLEADCAETDVYDPCFFKDDDGSVYIAFGVWDYYIAKMSEDMMSIQGEPHRLEIRNPEGPYGKGKTDDKVSLHKRGDIYYLSWGSYYAMSDSLFGVYECQGTIIDSNKMEKRFVERSWPQGPTQGRHGNHFQWNDQWYFTYCEMAFSNNRFFRDFWISKTEYAEDGKILPITIDSDCVR